MKTLIIILSFVMVSATDDVIRKPKLFYVSTSATTSTLSTYSVCYLSSKSPLVACVGRKRKRRTISFDGMETHDKSLLPSTSSSVSKENTEGGRSGRFLLYWITTTSISTSTSFTTTLTLSSVACTATGTGALCGQG